MKTLSDSRENAMPADVAAAYAKIRAYELDALAARLRAALPAPVVPAAPADPEGLVAGPVVDRHLAISAATRNRLVKEGMPTVIVGYRRRYNVAACRTWVEARGRKPTKAAVRDDVEIDDVLAHAGMRRAGGGR